MERGSVQGTGRQARRFSLAALLLGFLGHLLQRRGNAAIALACYREAVRFRPGDSGTLGEIGKIHFAARRFDEAADAFRDALQGEPRNAELHNRLGLALEMSWKLDEAERCYRNALQCRPHYAAALNNLGNIHRYASRLDDAEACYRAALTADPGYVEAHSNLGIVLTELKRYKEAEACCREALRLRPGFAGAMNNLAGVFKSMGRLDEAERTYREALSLDPGLLEAQVNLAVVRNDATRLAAALPYFENEFRRNPDSAFTNNRLGLALQAQGRVDEAQAYFERALELEPDNLDARANLGNNFVFQADIEKALPCYRKVIDTQPSISTHHSYAMYIHNVPDIPPSEIFEVHREWARNHADVLTPLEPNHGNSPDPAKKLKVGYVSADFCRHSVAYFIEPVIARHNVSSFEVYCYANVAEPDAVTERFKAIPGVIWRDTRLKTHDELADLIREDGIDILIDLIGHTSGSRLPVFARKPAPVQVTYLGYPDTTGLKAIDYRITDARADPPGMTERYHSEELVRMPHTFLVYLPPKDAPEVAPAPVEHKGHITFGSFNNLAKINGHVIRLWTRVMHAVPGSRLVLKSFVFSSEKARMRFMEMFAKEGIAGDRIDLLMFLPDVSSHLEIYREIDIGLDPFPYNGTTTTCEAMWMGVPVVTLAGTAHVSRVGVSLLDSVGLDGLVARDEDEYVRMAAELARDHVRLRGLRSSLRQRMLASPLADAEGFTRDLEASYREMWKRWCSARKSTKVER